MAIVTGKLCKVVVVVMMAMLAVAVCVLPSDFWWQGSGGGLVLVPLSVGLLVCPFHRDGMPSGMLKLKNAFA